MRERGQRQWATGGGGWGRSEGDREDPVVVVEDGGGFGTSEGKVGVGMM